MTPKQNQLLEFVRRYIADTGASPSFAEMQAELGLRSKSGVARLVNALVDAGKLIKRPGRNRSLEIANDLLGVPTSRLIAELERRGWRHG